MLKKLLSFLFLFAFILSMSHTSSVFAAPQRKTIKKPSSILRNYANKMEQKESKVSKRHEQRTKAIEKAQKDREKKLEEQKRKVQDARNEHKRKIEEQRRSVEKARNDRQRELEKQKRYSQRRQEQRKENIQNIKNNFNSLKDSFKFK